MGGSIGVDSTEGAGSTFWFTVRLERSLGAEPAGGRDPRLAGVRVLAVDDNATNREILCAQLEAAGMRCDSAGSGDAALSRLATAVERRQPYVLAILDQHMPDMDGFEVAHRIKADPRIAGTRLVMLSSLGRPLDPARLRAGGILTWATKPIWRTQLLRALTVALDDAQPGALQDPAPGEAVPGESSETRKKRVLLVEDTPVNAEVIGEILRTAGYVVDFAVDGLQAVEATRRDVFDLVLMDCQLPGIDGYEATRRIRNLEASGALARRSSGRRVPIVALTASAAVEDLERARLSGMDGHIPKPVDARRLLAVLAQHEGLQDASASRGPGEGPSAEAVVLDLGRALDRLQGNRELLSRVVDQFREEAVAARRQLREALERKDRSGMGYAAHRLRGQALALEGVALAAALGSLEMAAVDGQWETSAEGLRVVEHELARLLELIP
jgi:two-component system, sensor histidine kinase and response regulator